MRALVISFCLAAMAMPRPLEANQRWAGYALENGDTNGDVARDLCDAIYLIRYVMVRGPQPVPLATCAGELARVKNGDIDGDGQINLGDTVRFLMWLFGKGRPPAVPCAPRHIARVVPVAAEPYGMTYGEWSAAWWQWALSMDPDEHPLVDSAPCGTQQSGPVWFLGGKFCNNLDPDNCVFTVTRSCTVPGDKAIFFPILTTECSTFEGNGTTEEDLRSCATYWQNFATSMACEVDGRSLANVDGFRIVSPLFNYQMPKHHVFQAFGLPEGPVTSPSVSDGVFLMLAPLAPGEHRIHFFGVLDWDGAEPPDFLLDVTYELTVTP